MYSRDILGVPVEIIDDEPEKVGHTWKKQDIYEDEKVLVHEAMYKRKDGVRGYEERFLFEDDIVEYVKTLMTSDINDALEKLDIKTLIDIFDMEEVYL